MVNLYHNWRDPTRNHIGDTNILGFIKVAQFPNRAKEPLGQLQRRSDGDVRAAHTHRPFLDLLCQLICLSLSRKAILLKNLVFEKRFSASIWIDNVSV